MFEDALTAVFAIGIIVLVGAMVISALGSTDNLRDRLLRLFRRWRQ